LASPSSVTGWAECPTPAAAGICSSTSRRNAGTNKATSVTFDVPTSEFDGEVDALRANGIESMTFDFEGAEWKDGVASMGSEMRAVWFTDPDGNILNPSAGEM
jgi:hypothetical protein